MKRTVLFALICFISIKGISQDYRKIANEYCDCFVSIKDSIHPDFIRYIIAASDSTDFSMKLGKIMENESKNYRETLYIALRRIQRSIFNPSSDVGKCGADLKQKYYQYMYEQAMEREFFKKVINELEQSNQCTFYVAVLKSMYWQTTE